MLRVGNSFEEELGIPSGRLAVVSEELKGFELGTEAFNECRERNAKVIVEESIVTTGLNFSGESLEVERRLRQALIELVLVCRHIRSSS
jgi:hypothetical protein